MLLSTKGRYAVMALVEIARQSDSKPRSLGDVAASLSCRSPIWSSFS